MSSFRKTIISNCEKKFLIKNLFEWTRLDGRAFNEFREVKIKFGKDWGCCYVSLGKTKVIAQVSCELQQPKSSRPNEGTLNINLDLNPMADPNFEAGRPSDMSSQLNRLLEKCIKDSKAVDLESLCVKMNERAWAFRVDINVLNHEGNILDCASIASLAALAHFRRPDVTCDGEEYKIHNIKQRDPIPTVIHHYPVCVTYAILKEGEYIIADPTLLEEGVAEAFLSIALNAYKELCGLHLGGKAHLATKDILETSSRAAKRANEVVELIKINVEKDTNKRLSTRDSGFHKTINIEEPDLPLSKLSICLDTWSVSKKKKKEKHKKNKNTNKTLEMSHNNTNDDTLDEPNIQQDTADNVVDLENGMAKLEESGWSLVESDEDAEDDIVLVEPKPAQSVVISDTDSEEEAIVINP